MTSPLHLSRETRTPRRADRLVRFPKLTVPDLEEIIWFGKVEPGYTNGWANTSYFVDAILCDYKGVEDDPPVPLLLSTGIRDNKWTALFTDYIVGFAWDWIAECFVICTDHFDAMEGTVRAISTDAAIPDGWEEVRDYEDELITRGRTVRGLNPLDEDYFESGGSEEHTHIDHPPHSFGNVLAESPGGISGVNAYLTPTPVHTPPPHSTESHLDPYVLMKFIKRTH